MGLVQVNAKSAWKISDIHLLSYALVTHTVGLGKTKNVAQYNMAIRIVNGAQTLSSNIHTTSSSIIMSPGMRMGFCMYTKYTCDFRDL